MVWRYNINDSYVCRQNTNIEKIYIYASERDNFCCFFQYFVGTSETLSVQMTYLSAYMYRQISKYTDKNSEKTLLGGGGQLPPPPPSGYASDARIVSVVHNRLYFDIVESIIA